MPTSHPFRRRWNHNTHYYPLLAARIPVAAPTMLDLGCGEGTFCRFVAEVQRVLRPRGVLVVLGYGRYGGWRDAPAELRDVLAHRLLSRRAQPWEPATTKAEPSGTWSAARAEAERLLPGCSYRRLPLWRYLVEWRKGD